MHIRCPGCRTVFEIEQRSRGSASCPTCSRQISRRDRIVVPYPHLPESLQNLIAWIKVFAVVALVLLFGLFGRWLKTTLIGGWFADGIPWRWLSSPKDHALSQILAGIPFAIFFLTLLLTFPIVVFGLATNLFDWFKKLEKSTPALTEPSADGAMEAWWLDHHGRSTGPFTLALLIESVQAGDFPLDSRVCRVGCKTWTTVAGVIESSLASPNTSSLNNRLEVATDSTVAMKSPEPSESSPQSIP